MRKLLIAILTVAALLGAAAAVVVNRLDGWLAENRGIIESRAAEALGRPVEFDSIGGSVGLGVAVTIAGLRLPDDPAFSNDNIVELDELRVGVRLIPALLGRYEISNITLIEPRLQLVRTVDGYNLAALVPASAESTGEQDDTDLAAADGGLAAVIALLDIENGRISMTDNTRDKQTVVLADAINCSVSDLALDAPVNFRLGASLTGAGSATAEITGSAGPYDSTSPGETRIRIDGVLSDLDAAELMRTWQLLADGQAPVLARGLIGARLSATGALDSLAMSASIDASGARLEAPGLFEKPAGTAASIDLNATLAGDSLRIADTTVTLANARMGIDGTADIGGESPTWDLKLKADPFALEPIARMAPALGESGVKTLEGSGSVSLRVVHAEAGDETGGPDFAGTLSFLGVNVQQVEGPPVEDLSATIVIEGEQLRLEPASMRVADSAVTVEGVLRDFASPSGTFRLESGLLDLTALSGQAQRHNSSGEPSGDSAMEGAIHDRLEMLRVTGTFGAGRSSTGPSDDMQVDVKLESASGYLAGAPYTDLRASARKEGSRYVINPLRLSMFGGVLRGEGLYVPGNESPQEFNFEVGAEDIDLGELVASQVLHADLLLSGSLDGRLSLAAVGEEWSAIRDAVVGGGRLGLTQGMIRDVNIAESLLASLTGLPGLTGLISPEVRTRHPQLFSSTDTVFEDMAGEFSIAGGRMQSRDLTLRAQDFSLHGRAAIGLDRSLDVRATFEASEKLTASLIQSISAAKYLTGSSGRIQIPFQLRGTLPNVRPEPDRKFISDALGRAVIQGLADKLLKPQQPNNPDPAEKPAAAEAPSVPGATGTQAAPRIPGLPDIPSLPSLPGFP